MQHKSPASSAPKPQKIQRKKAIKKQFNLETVASDLVKLIYFFFKFEIRSSLSFPSMITPKERRQALIDFRGNTRWKNI